jgi:cardiolipin synthase
MRTEKSFLVFLALFISVSAPAAPKQGLLGRLASCESLVHPTAEWIQLVEANPALLAHSKRIESFLTDYAATGKVDRAAAESEVIQILADLRDANQLRPVLAKVVHEARKKPGFPQIPGDDSAVADQLFMMIDAELYSRGFSPLGARAKFKPWAKLAAEQALAVERSGTSTIGSSQFFSQFAKLVGMSAQDGTKVRLLNEAKDALSERVRMVNGAKKSIWLMTWAMYGDNVGNEFADLLIKKFKEGVDVRLIVDGQTARRVGYRESIAKLKEAGVPVVEWTSKANPYFGQHRKFMVIDHETGVGEAIAGGRNLGDDYLHTGTKPNSAKWRDTDVLYQGPPVEMNARRFQTLWNESGASHIPDARVRVRQIPSGTTVMGIIDHVPNAEGHDPIYLGLLKSIESATKSIDIANAYVILTPAMESAIIRARARGVRVRVFTNSATSIDEPIITAPILKSLAALMPSGVEVYLKKGDTLHSKFAVFDGDLSWVMSYNLHPRSLRYEGETANVIFDRKFSGEVLADFEKDLAIATPIQTVKDLGIPPPGVGDLVSFYFFNQF